MTIAQIEKLPHLCLSPLTINGNSGPKLLLANRGCLDQKTYTLLDELKIEYETAAPRPISHNEYRQEAKQCHMLFKDYVAYLTKELNRMHGLSCSKRYWATLLHGSLYPTIASFIDHYNVVKFLSENYPGVVADVADSHDLNYFFHMAPGGSSRLFHLLIFSSIINESELIKFQTIDRDSIFSALNLFGDGKKQASQATNMPTVSERVKKKLAFLGALKRALKGELPLSLARYTRSNVLALGNQYLLPATLKSLLTKSGGGRFAFYEKRSETEGFQPFDALKRDAIHFPAPSTAMERSLQKCLRRFLPTILIENFQVMRDKISRVVPARKVVILNSQHCDGAEILDFFIAQAVEEQKAHHLMICHGGCYGVMDISIQENIWGQISDSYALWSNPKRYDSNCDSVKMPSLRFHRNQDRARNQILGQDILLFATGFYPFRYAYNSIFPYTLDDTYDEWQVRFMSTLDSEHLQALVIRDFHKSERLKVGGFTRWASERNVKVTARSVPFDVALRNAKLSVQTVPQTTYLETIVTDHPTICYWNPDANIIRPDFSPYYDMLVEIGVLHYSPESAGRQVNQVAGDPQQWWQSQNVRQGLKTFRENVCYTSRDAIDKWAQFIRSRLS